MINLHPIIFLIICDSLIKQSNFQYFVFFHAKIYNCILYSLACFHLDIQFAHCAVNTEYNYYDEDEFCVQEKMHEQTFSGNNSEKQPPLVKSPEQLNDRCEVNLGCDGQITVKQARCCHCI